MGPLAGLKWEDAGCLAIHKGIFSRQQQTYLMATFSSLASIVPEPSVSNRSKASLHSIRMTVMHAYSPSAIEAGMHRCSHQGKTPSLQANLISCFCSSVKPCCFPFFLSLRAAVTAFLYELCRAMQQPSLCKYAACQRRL